MSADSTLRADEKELGVCLADIGAGSTDMIVYSDGMVAHTGVVPVGGDHFTNDIAVGMRTPLVAAEKIKKQFGHTISSKVPDGNEIEVPAVGGQAVEADAATVSGRNTGAARHGALRADA